MTTITAANLMMTDNALRKARGLNAAFAALSDGEGIAWLRRAVGDGDELPRDKLRTDLDPGSRIVVLGGEYSEAFTGDRLVAVVVACRYQQGRFSCVTVRQLREVQPHAPRKVTTPWSTAPAIAAKLAAVVPPSPATAPKRPPPTSDAPGPVAPRAVAKPAPPPPAPPTRNTSPKRPDSKGAQLARMELARLRVEHGDVARAIKMTPARLSAMINARVMPDIAEALALHKVLGIPLESWGEAP